jgi:hypothetical protein
VVGALAGVLVRRRRPPPPLAQLLQPRLQTRGEANLLLITTCVQASTPYIFYKECIFYIFIKSCLLGPWTRRPIVLCHRFWDRLQRLPVASRNLKPQNEWPLVPR